jgi:hypothetical protein
MRQTIKNLSLSIVLSTTVPVIAQDLATTPLLKHRVEIVADPAEREPNVKKIEVTHKTDEGVDITRAEQATGLDLLKTKIRDLETMRLMESSAATQKNPRRLVLHARFGVLKDAFAVTSTKASTSGAAAHIESKTTIRQPKKQVFLRLTDQAGNVLANEMGTGAQLDTAAAAALENIQNQLFLLPWRCRIAESNDGKMLIECGYPDGLRKGQSFVGYSLTADAKTATGKTDEYLIMRYGTKAGIYEVTEVGEEFSQLKPKEGNLLSPGDFLVIPAVRLRDANPATRASKIWDRIYKEQNINRKSEK